MLIEVGGLELRYKMGGFARASRNELVLLEAWYIWDL